MWTALVLSSSIDCKTICNKIQKDIVEKCNRENIPLEGKLLRIEIKNITDLPAPENNEILKIPES